ncbi:uncharacterized protein PG998_014195 [Apiospora kogelbergensis]|uniref:uncharacterized protein n=1 Tax=Apiospora kogelbergensis TaxID=1337665 RepID=UPI00312E233C
MATSDAGLQLSKVDAIYSIGVVLLGLGLLDTAAKIAGKHLGSDLRSGDPTAEDIRKIWVEKTIPDLRRSWTRSTQTLPRLALMAR